ncbi:sigma-70 family RNA polymerase sigma factor [Actinoplanes siamensis]|nr:sigma-70 family RNA polymerase sigma factor [Actinoplanes siamensis]
MTVVHDAVSASAELIAATRADLGMSRAAFGAMTGRSEGTIRRYEDRASRPPAIFFHNLIEAEPGCGLRFNDFAPALGFRRIESMNPDDYGSIHEYFLGVRVLHRRSRMSFAAMLSVSATHLAAVEHRIKPEPQLVQRLARLFLRPHYNYSDLVRRFRTLRPDPRATRLRGMFRELRDPQTAGHERSRIRADLIGDNADLARQLAKREARYLPDPGDAANAWATALVKAVDGHDPRYGDFVPYLRKWIIGEVRHEARREWQSGTSATLRASAARISRARDDLHQQLRRDPTPAEIATHLRLPVTAVADVLNALAARHSRPLEHDLAAPAAPAQVTGFSSAMQNRLARLQDRQRTVIELRFLHGLDDAEIAESLTISPTSVPDIVNTALAQLRDSIS